MWGSPDHVAARTHSSGGRRSAGAVTGLEPCSKSTGCSPGPYGEPEEPGPPFSRVDDSHLALDRAAINKEAPAGPLVPAEEQVTRRRLAIQLAAIARVAVHPVEGGTKGTALQFVHVMTTAARRSPVTGLLHPAGRTRRADWRARRRGRGARGVAGLGTAGGAGRAAGAATRAVRRATRRETSVRYAGLSRPQAAAL